MIGSIIFIILLILINIGIIVWLFIARKNFIACTKNESSVCPSYTCKTPNDFLDALVPPSQAAQTPPVTYRGLAFRKNDDNDNFSALIPLLAASSTQSSTITTAPPS